MIPPLPTRPLRLQPRILNRNQIPKHTRLDHTLPEQLSTVSSTRAQFLTRSLHRLPLSLQLQLVLPSLLPLVQVPGAVDRPVAEEASAGESKGTGSEWVVEEVADQCCSIIIELWLVAVV